jgi:hypothetical protein
MAKNPAGKQANTKGSKASFSQQSVKASPSPAPSPSRMPTMRPDNFAQIVAAQGGSDNSGGGSNAMPAMQPPGDPSSQGGFFANFNPLNFGLIGIARSLFSGLGEGGNRGPTARDVPQPRPTIRQSGDQLIATRDVPRFGFSAGDTATVPDYSPFSVRGFTSTDPGNVMRNVMGAERNMAAFPLGQNDNGDQTQPTAPVVDAAPNPMPSVKPAWWPSYLPWPPAPDSPMAELATSGYSPSISTPQTGISSPQGPMMMGIGGILRRP